MSAPQPPPYAIHEVKLGTGQEVEGKIVNVSLYANRADVSRGYRFSVASGQNKVVVFGLPNVLDHSSIRVEGRGNATIQDVTISREPVPTPPSTSSKLEELEDEKEVLKLSLERCQKTLAGLDRFLQSRTEAKPENGGFDADVSPLVDNYNSAAEKYDKKALELRRELKKLEDKITEEKSTLRNSVTVDRERVMKATIGVFAEAQTEVELFLKYAVTGASWSALYDIRATTDTKESPVEVVYKASITQSTGEDWTDVPITLETATPTFGLSLPTLGTWNLSVYKPPPPRQNEYKKRKSALPGAHFMSRSKSRKDSSEVEESDDDMGFGLFDDGPSLSAAPPPPLAPMSATVASVTSKGNVNATFRVPGLITIPSDGVPHNVTIVSLKPEARLQWVTAPGVGTEVHLTTRITNTSEYTLLPGSSSVYVDGSFISKSSVPPVSPQESFTCALGLDPSIRIAFPPVIKKSSTSGILTKTSSTSYTQRISVHNTKTLAIENLTILGRIPVSSDAQITVKLISPSLPPPVSQPTAAGANVTSPSTSSIKDFAAKMAGAKAQVKIAEGIVASWYGGNEDGDGSNDRLGRDGKVQWVCTLDAQMKVDLTLHWEVSAAKEVIVVGL